MGALIAKAHVRGTFSVKSINVAFFRPTTKPRSTGPRGSARVGPAASGALPPPRPGARDSRGRRGRDESTAQSAAAAEESQSTQRASGTRREARHGARSTSGTRAGEGEMALATPHEKGDALLYCRPFTPRAAGACARYAAAAAFLDARRRGGQIEPARRAGGLWGGRPGLGGGPGNPRSWPVLGGGGHAWRTALWVRCAARTAGGRSWGRAIGWGTEGARQVRRPRANRRRGRRGAVAIGTAGRGGRERWVVVACQLSPHASGRSRRPSSLRTLPQTLDLRIQDSGRTRGRRPRMSASMFWVCAPWRRAFRVQRVRLAAIGGSRPTLVR